MALVVVPGVDPRQMDMVPRFDGQEQRGPASGIRLAHQRPRRWLFGGFGGSRSDAVPEVASLGAGSVAGSDPGPGFVFASAHPAATGPGTGWSFTRRISQFLSAHPRGVEQRVTAWQPAQSPIGAAMEHGDDFLAFRPLFQLTAPCMPDAHLPGAVGSLRDGPRRQHPAVFQAEIPVQLRSMVFVDHERRCAGATSPEAVTAAIKDAADWLHNTPAIARDSNVDPRLAALFEQGKVGDFRRQQDRAVLALLSEGPHPARRRLPRPGESERAVNGVRTAPYSLPAASSGGSEEKLSAADGSWLTPGLISASVEGTSASAVPSAPSSARFPECALGSSSSGFIGYFLSHPRPQ